MKNVTILLAVAAMLAVPAYGATWNGDGDGSSWNDGDNWDSDAVPTTGVNVISAACTEADPVLINSGVHATSQKLNVGIWGGHPGYLTLKDGGSFTTTSWELRIGHATGTGATDPFSIFTQEGGSVNIQNYGINIGPSSGKGRYLISGGQIGNLASVNNKLDMSGGIGEFIVDCTDDADGGTAVVVSSIKASGYVQNATSMLEFRLDTNGSACAITVEGNVDLAGTLTLTGTRTSADALVLMTYTGTLTGTFDTEPAGWDISYTGGQVTATIPEPATMSLLVIGGIGVLIRRKRR